MAAEFINGDGVVFCVWGVPERNDFDQLRQELLTSYAKVAGGVVYVARVPADAPAPDAPVRSYLNAMIPSFVPLFCSCHVVLEGSGFMAAMKRGVLVSLFNIGKQRNMYFVHSSTADVEWKVPVNRQAALRRVLTKAEATGLLSCGSRNARVA
jgi:hypothetical protein